MAHQIAERGARGSCRDACRAVASRCDGRPPQLYLFAFVVFELVVACQGCSPCRLAGRTLVGEPSRYSIRIDDKRSLATYQDWAQHEWHQVVIQREDLRLTPDYRAGFFAGFVDFVHLGGSGAPPPIPPREYWDVGLRSLEGKHRVEQWFAGFRHGADLARVGNYRAHATIATSLAIPELPELQVVARPQPSSAMPTQGGSLSVTPLPAAVANASVGTVSGGVPSATATSPFMTAAGVMPLHEHPDGVGSPAGNEYALFGSPTLSSSWVLPAGQGADELPSPDPKTVVGQASQRIATLPARPLDPIAAPINPSPQPDGEGTSVHTIEHNLGTPNDRDFIVQTEATGSERAVSPGNPSHTAPVPCAATKAAAADERTKLPAERPPARSVAPLRQPESVSDRVPPESPPLTDRPPVAERSLGNLLMR